MKALLDPPSSVTSATAGELAKRVEASTDEAYNWKEALTWSLADVPGVLPLAFDYAELPPPQTVMRVTFGAKV